ncbi:MAG: sigma-54 interaction domain-containing protein [Candidatus Binatia bacterium]
MEEKQPWVGCFLSHVLVTYIEGTFKGKRGIDYSSLFREIEGFEIPSDPASFLKDVNNWIPLRVLRELLSQCEKISGEKDVAYHAARAYFDPHKKQFPSLFEVIARVLNDVRSLLICADLWASVQTNYLKFQSFEGPGERPDLYMLAKFGENARPGVGTINFLRGTCEGFIRLSSFVDDVQCIEELSQLQVEDIVREFPDFDTIREGDRLSILHRPSQRSVVEAIRIPLKHESIPLSEEFVGKVPDAAVVPPHDGRINVLTPLEEMDPSKRTHAPPAYKIVKPGVLSHGSLSYSFKKDQFYDAPYSRLRVAWKGSLKIPKEISAEHVRREISRLLFEHLERIRQTQLRMIQHNIDKRRLTLENIHLRREIEREYSFAGILGESQEIQDVIGLIRSIAETDVTVLIQGETGTGKELIARAIHYNSPRSAKRFVALNCGSFAETLLESELFGHERGAFTGAITQKKGIFEAANGGTLFLDEIGEIPPSTQVKLLRVLQEGEFQRVGSTDSIYVDVRIVAATNQSLEDLIKTGRFRQDLYYRLNVVPVHVPPLRERAGDIPLLVSHFIEKRNPRLNKQIAGMSPQAMALLMAYDWPGNVRELENVIQRMMVVSKSEILDVQDIPAEIRGVEQGHREKAKDLKNIARETAGLAERSVILDALSQTGWNVTRAARSLGVSRATLQTKMKLYGLRGPAK